VTEILDHAAIGHEPIDDRWPRFTGKKILVVGFNVRGRAAMATARLLHQRGADVTVTDRKPLTELADDVASLPPGVRHELGGFRTETFAAADLIVLAHEVPCRHELAVAKSAGVPIINQVELAAGFVAGSLVAITGTNGKSTTATILHEILRLSSRPLFVGGSHEGQHEGQVFLGRSLAEAAFTPATGAGGIAVVEISSYQLDFTERFSPTVGILLNISPDHLGRHGGLEAYAAAKAKIFASQTAQDFAIYNLDDALVAPIGQGARAIQLPVSTRQSFDESSGNQGGWLERGGAGGTARFCLRLPGQAVERYRADLPGIHGRHNQTNALAAALTARLLGATPDQIEAGLRACRPLPHRMNPLGQRNGIDFFDDSQAKNVGAVVAGLLGFDRKVVLIAGGQHRVGRDYTPLLSPMKKIGRAAVLIGAAAGPMARTLVDAVPVVRATTVENAVTLALRFAKPGDAVVFSPGCAGNDMFSTRGERGLAFAAAIQAVCAGSAAG
jgi:UDP-N-acetylmuramoylalanine--D-glutamate ligase